MTTPDAAPDAARRPITAPGTRAVAGLARTMVARGGGIVLVVAAGMSALVVATYDDVIGSAPGGAAALAALAGNPAIRTLFGEPVALDDPGGFTVWRTGTVLAVLVALWAALTATRMLRGEEDTGRWDLLLSGRVSVGAVVATHLGVLLVAVTAIGGAVSLALLGTGTAAGGALVHGVSLTLLGAVSAGIGGVTAQLLPERGAAAGAAVMTLVAGLLARMVADGVTALNWLHWLSPFGLAALARPYDTDRAVPLLVLAVAAVTLLATTVALSRHRDLRGAPLSSTATRRPRTRLLGSPAAFALRRLQRPLAGWAGGITAFFLLIGLIATSMTTFLADNPLFADMAARAGFAELGSVAGYAATLFALLPVALSGFVAGRIAGLARAESARRLDLLLAAPLSRRRLLAAEVAVTVLGAAVLTVVAALAVSVGTTAAGTPLSPGAALAGAANTLPITALGLGAATLALGRTPEAVLPAGMVPAAGGFVLNVVADSVGAPAWVGSLSPFAHLSPVPVTIPDWTATTIMVAIAVALCVAGTMSYTGRDVRSG